jgi:RNA polymerase-binding transcription factor DksA
MALDLKAIRTRLEDMRQDYQAQIEDLTVGEDQVLPSDPGHDGSMSDDYADDADPMFQAENNLAQVANLRDLLDLVNGALARLDDGSYGKCLACGKPIDERRLEALPYAQYCLEDQQKHETNVGMPEVAPGTPPI